MMVFIQWTNLATVVLNQDFWPILGTRQTIAPYLLITRGNILKNNDQRELDE
jgi:hypothetical protein